MFEGVDGYLEERSLVRPVFRTGARIRVRNGRRESVVVKVRSSEVNWKRQWQTEREESGLGPSESEREQECVSEY